VSGEVASTVAELLSQDEPEARRLAVQRIPGLAGADAADLLVRALGDEDWRVRKEAAQVAAACEGRAEILPVLARSLREKVNIGLRNAAVEAFVAIGADSVGVAVEALSRLDADGRKLAVEVLGGVPDVHGVAALARALRDPDANVRAAAAEALGTAALAGEEARAQAIDALTGALATRETMLLLAALESLSRLEAKLPFSAVAPFVDEPLLRRYAIATAAASRERAAILALCKAVSDDSSTIARQAVLALDETWTALGDDLTLAIRDALSKGAHARRTHERVLAMARAADDPQGRGAAILLLGFIADPTDVPLLVQALGDDEALERAELALRLFGRDVVEPLLQAARGASPATRASVLPLAADLAAEAGDALLGALRDGLLESSPDVAAAALGALASRGESHDLEAMAPLVTNQDPRLAAAAASAVSTLAARHPVAARALFAKIESSESMTLGALLLGAVASSLPLGERDVAFLLRALANSEAHARRVAVEALAAVKAGAAVDAIAFALADEEREVQLAAVRALGRLGRVDPLVSVINDARDPELVAASLRALGDADPERAFRAARPLVAIAPPAVATAAVEALGRLRRRHGESRPQSLADIDDALVAALDHADSEVVKVALSELAFQPDARALARVGLCLDHPSWEVRRLAAELLGQNKTQNAKALLRARFERERDPLVRAAIATAVTVRPPPSDPPEEEED
jgi:HEAT repeat protein